MSKQIFVNLPVKDLKKTVEFFTKLGYTFNPQFTDENATCMIVSENIFVMLLVEPFFKGFTKKEIADTSKCNEAIICLSAESREEIDDIIKKAVDAGADKSPQSQDPDFMYSRGFMDLDGHYWEYVYMDMSKMPASN
ncbi:MAG: VOC family protein [Bacteroidetes bacterium]|nr:VOC family protein [Bacteroidota bacterium]